MILMSTLLKEVKVTSLDNILKFMDIYGFTTVVNDLSEIPYVEYDKEDLTRVWDKIETKLFSA